MYVSIDHFIYINLPYKYNSNEIKVTTCFVYTCNYLVLKLYCGAFSFSSKCEGIETIICIVYFNVIF